MAEKTYDLTFEANQGLIHLQAKFGHKLAMINHAPLDYEDMYQVASIAFVLAAQGYNPDSGLKFSAYYTKVAFSQFRREIGVMCGVKNLNGDQRAAIADRRAENARRGAAGEAPLPEMAYGLRPVQFSDITTPDGEGDPFVDTLQADTATPEQIVMRRQQWDQATANLSPMAQLVLSWLQDPPPELLRELRSQMVLAERVTDAGGRARRGWRDGITLANIGRFLAMLSDNKSKGEFALVERELLDVAAALED